MEKNGSRLQRFGYSNKLFFYMLAGRGTFNIRFQYDFYEEINPELMLEAIEEALMLYPEFKIRVYPQNGKFVSERNDRPVPFFHGLKQTCEGLGQQSEMEPDPGHILGSEETNGYLFYFAYEKQTLLISYYHGLSDTKGVLSFMSTSLFLYAQKTGRPLSEEETKELKGRIRLCASDIPADEKERLDPYDFYADDTVEARDLYQSPGAAVFHAPQYPEESRELNRYVIEFSLSGFLSITKQYGVSAAPLLLAIASSAFYRTGKVDEEKPVIAMLPVDLRKHIGADTMVNCSDGILIPMIHDDLDRSLKELSSGFKTHISSQICRENFIRIITDKVKFVQSFEESTEDLREIVERNTKLPPLESFHPFTYAMTYPGSLNMGAGLDRMVRDIRYYVYARACSFEGYTYNDRFRINIDLRSDDGSWAEQIAETIRSLLLPVSLKACGKVQGDIFLLM